MNTPAREIVRGYSARIEAANIFYFAPNIPSRKLRNAIKAFALTVREGDALVLVDNSFFGSAKAGGLLTKDTLYVRNLGEEPQSIALADMDRVALATKPRGLQVNDMKFLHIEHPGEEPVRLFVQMLRDLRALQEGKNPVGRSVREIVKRHSTIVRAVNVFFAPQIPPQKLRNAVKSFAPAVAERDALVLVDHTAFGSAKNGILLSEDALHIRDSHEQQRMALADIESVTFEPETSFLHVDGMRFWIPCRGQESMLRFARMMRDLSALRRPATPSPLETPGEVAALALKVAPTGGTEAMHSIDLARIFAFLKKRLQGKYNTYMVPRMPGEKETNARASFRIPENEKMLVLVTFSGSGKDGVAFTDTGMYVKRFFHEPVALPYSEMPACSYDRFREIIPGDESSREKELIAIGQQIKNIVMYGEPNARPAPPDPDKNLHPVREWFINAGSFVFFVILIPGLIGVELAKAGHLRLGGWVGLVSMLSWFAWFHSHRVSAPKKNLFAFSTVLKRMAVGVLASASLAGAVLFDRHASAPDGVRLMEGIHVVAVSLFGVALCMALYFKVSKYIHENRMASAIKRVAYRYLENERAAGMTELPGLLDAGVCQLGDDADIREVCRAVAKHSAHPLGPYRDILRDIDLMVFFELARDRGYDFDRHGRPEELAQEVRQGPKGIIDTRNRVPV
ncbi:MAG: hypothetical protein JXL20_01775 [Deltaproteobacteria bacterium]|nr:hypothetical protein [Deltaproteobacteria bacterium]